MTPNLGVSVQLNATVMSELAIYKVAKLAVMFYCITCKVLAAE